jgi:two-component sensor histidine kinase
VISIAHQSFRDRGPAIDEARRSFDARIRALAQTHSRLADTNWLGVPFEKMLADEIAPYAHADGGNVRLNGPRITLTPKCAVTLGMAIHELTTNAAKHGAFTAKNGAVDVGWEMDRKEKQLRIKWIESGGSCGAGGEWSRTVCRARWPRT